ncbi:MULTISPECIES: helix-turn-helix domain-containing protein [Haloferax]|nr:MULTISPECIES: helix-turn-helix domain-containing protein [Haloferax]MDS0241640.1 helix-turn-helix domain-containing protein [Haloferax sp. S2CR25]MDS0444761.1 helix-turn-helix domain-containing protein [Haloferax sp. S2CR25-2]
MADSTGGVAEAEHDTSREQHIRLLLEIEPAKRCSCPLAAPESSVENVHTQLDGDTCHAEVTVGDGETSKVVHTTTHVGDDCLCRAFGEFGCVPRIRRADGKHIVVETYLSDRETISNLVGRLDEVAERVCLRRLTSDGRGDSNESKTATIDLSSLTAKQREAALIAVHHGYYETPRRTELAALAEALGISKSALSQRLNAVEAKLATAVFDSE